MDTQTRLLDLAELAMRRHGYGGFSYADIARDAGIRKASIHHHFPAKADLGLAVLDRYADQLAGQLAMINSSTRTGAEALRKYMQECRMAMGEGDMVSLLAALLADAAQLPDAVRHTLQRLYQLVAEWLGQVMQRGRQDRSISVSGDPAQEGLAALAHITGAQIAARATGNPAHFDEVMATLTTRLRS